MSKQTKVGSVSQYDEGDIKKKTGTPFVSLNKREGERRQRVDGKEE